MPRVRYGRLSTALPGSWNAEAPPEDIESYGKYRLLERIATGGMAEVFRALSSSIGGFQKLVALKRILPHLSTDAEFVSLFIDEAKLTVSLTHSNIVQVFDFGRIDNNYFIAMEFIEGKDMTQVLIKQSRRRQTVPLAIGCYILGEVSKALEYAHNRRGRDDQPLGVVHRDVSPHNILVSYDGEVKITDFGIAKARNKVSMTRPGIVLGKFAYMSPEQALGRDVDHRSDVYSAGITLYETLTGRRLFYSEDSAQVLAKVRNPRVPPPSRYNPEIPPSLDAVVLKALAIDPRDRFQACRELTSALQQELHAQVSDFSDSHLAAFMRELFEDEVGAARFAMAPPPPQADRGATTQRMLPAAASPSLGRGLDDGTLDDPVLFALREKLRRDPNLWTLAELGERLLKMRRPGDAERVLRAAAAKFAQNGLLVQAVALFAQIRAFRGWNAELTLTLEGVRSLPGASSDAVLRHLGITDGDALDEVGELIQQIVLSQGPSEGAPTEPSPLFSYLDPAEFANLVSLLDLKRIPPGKVIIREGDPGESLSIIARGRVLIYCRNFHGTKVYLSSLSDGDCFGEFSFFTGEPRAATVEAMEEVLLFEVQHRDFDTILERFPNLTNALLKFYKSRVVGTLLAKSEIFGVLRARERQWLLDRLKLELHPTGAVILREGDESDGFYLIKSGEVEVFSERAGADRYVFISKLKSGNFFGEIGAVTGQPRVASVRALSACELLRLSDADMRELVRSAPDILEVLQSHIALREAETARRLTAGGALI